MVIREILKKASEILKEKGIEDSFNDAAVLFASASEKSKTYIFTNMDESPDSKTLKKFDDFILERSRHMPVAYITGRAWFMSLEFDVNEFTLIPRPETEGLVEESLRLIKDINNDRIAILDLCTGCGCAGISIANYNKKVTATLSDINHGCITITEKNIKKHNLGGRVTAIIGDLYQAVGNEKFDCIIANPPYIPSEDIQKLEDDVRLFEPALALDGGTDGFDFYKKIIKEAPEHLKLNGWLVQEAGIYQADTIKDLLTTAGFKEVSIINDINEIPRIVSAKYI